MKNYFGTRVKSKNPFLKRTAMKIKLTSRFVEQTQFLLNKHTQLDPQNPGGEAPVTADIDRQ